MIVLDTHVLIWYLLDDKQLNRSLRSSISAEPKSVLVPTICLWETLVLAEKGRIEMSATNPAAALRGWVRDCGLVETPLTGEIAVLSRTLSFHHDDPADRFIAATAYANDARLATSDERLRTLDWISLAY